MISIFVSKALAVVTDNDTLTSGMVGAKLRLEFTDDWDGLTKTAIFKAGEVTKAVTQDQWAGNECIIPHETLVTAGEHLSVGVYGVSEENKVIIPTIWARIGIVRTGVDPSADESTDGTLPVWAQIQETAEGAKKTADGAYVLPDGGIPKSDLSADVQASLNKADTALQAHQSLAEYRKAAEQDVIDATKQDKLIAGENITIAEDGTISSTSIGYLPVKLTDTGGDASGNTINCTADKTFAEVEAVVTGGKAMLVADIGGALAACTLIESGTNAAAVKWFEFAGLTTEDWLINITAYSDETWRVQIVQVATANDLIQHTSDSVKHITSTERTKWNSKQDALTAGDNITITNNVISSTSGFSGDYNDLTNKPDLAGYRLVSDSYTKTETDKLLATAGKVKTVNNIEPDSNGNITIEGGTGKDGTKWFTSSTVTNGQPAGLSGVNADDLCINTVTGEVFKALNGGEYAEWYTEGFTLKGADGATGADGTSVTVASVTESTADGGSNVVTFSDGKTVTIKNGTKGSTGAKGDKGDTGAKGADGANFAWNLASGTANGEGWSKTSFDAAERTFSRSTTATSEGYIQRTVSLTAGKTYTFSAYLWSNGNVKSADIFAYDKTVKDVYQKSSITLTTSPVFYSLTFTPKTNSAYDWTNAAIRFDNNGSTASGTQAILYAKDVKLEEGSVATPWCTTQAETIGKDGSDASVTKANVVAALGYTPAQSGNCVTYTSHANVTAGKKEGVTTYTYGQSPMVVSNGVIIGGSAQNAGLVTRGICGVTTPDDTGACSLEYLYINYDGDNKYTRAMVLGAGSAGNDITTSTATSTEATKVYGTTQAAVRGDQMVNYVTAKISGKQDKSTLETDVAAKGFTKNTGTYSKPSGGIPKSDLASAVQTSLDRADTLTDAYINNLINTALGVIENGSY